MDTNRTETETETETANNPMEGYCRPIARTGEQQFACIHRNRSGVSAGEIDFGSRFLSPLSDRDQQDAIDAVYAVYLNWCRETGKKSKCDESK